MQSTAQTRNRTATLAGVAILVALAFILALAQPSQAATWRLYQKHNCIEVLTDGTRYIAKNVCKDNGSTAQYVKYYSSGSQFTDPVRVCLPYGTQVSLGIKSEFRGVSASNGDGCNSKHNGGKPYRF